MKKVICFGAGKYLEQYFEIISQSSQIIYICDNDQLKWESCFIYKNKPTEIKIKSPDILKDAGSDVQLLITSTYSHEIVNQLKEMDIDTFYVIGGGPEYICYKHQALLWEYIKKSVKEIIKDDKRYPVNMESYGKNVYRWWSNIFSHGRVQSMIPYLHKDSKILDYGCGCGTAVLNLLLRGYNAFGIEVDKGKYAYIMQLIKDLSLPEEWRRHFILYDGQRICFDDEEFDFVFSLQVLEHVTDCYESVREMLRVCKRGGILQLECPDYDAFYEKHFLVDFGKPLYGNKNEFCRWIEEIGGDENYARALNFINGRDVYNMIMESGCEAEIVDYSFCASKDANSIYIVSRKK